MADMDNNTNNHDGQDAGDWNGLTREEGGNVNDLLDQKGMQDYSASQQNQPGSMLNTSPGIPSPMATPETAQQHQGGNAERVSNDPMQPGAGKVITSKGWYSPFAAAAEGFLNLKNSQLKEVDAPKEKTTAELEAERLAKAKADLEEEGEDTATSEDVSQALRAEDILLEEEQEEDHDLDAETDEDEEDPDL